MNIFVTGGTGFIGRALCLHLQKNHALVIKTRRPDLVEDGVRAIKDMSELLETDRFDLVINLAGEAIADKRWSADQKHTLLHSRLKVTEELIAYFKETPNKPTLFISGSAIGYYGVVTSDDRIDEDSLGDDSFSNHLCSQWEAAARQAEALGIRTCILRTGIVLGRNGGALKKMLLPFKYCLGGPIGKGNQWMPWIHMSDMIGIIEHCISQPSVSGAINCTSPIPVTNKVFTHTLGRVLKRPTLFTMPALVVKLLMGEMGKELLLAGKKVVPVKAVDSGYQFTFSQLEDALQDVLS